MSIAFKDVATPIVTSTVAETWVTVLTVRIHKREEDAAESHKEPDLKKQKIVCSEDEDYDANKDEENGGEGQGLRLRATGAGCE